MEDLANCYLETTRPEVAFHLIARAGIGNAYRREVAQSISKAETGEAGTEASPPISNMPLQLKVECALRARC